MNSTINPRASRDATGSTESRVSLATVLCASLLLLGGCSSEEGTEPQAPRNLDRAKGKATMATVKGHAEEALEQRIASLIESIDDDWDVLHSDYTPAVRRLIKIGPPAIEPLLELMLVDNSFTRTHAQRALAGIVKTMLGYEYGKGWPEGIREGNERFLRLWRALGDLHEDAPSEERQKSVRKWREWLDQGAPIDFPVEGPASDSSAIEVPDSP